MGKQGISKRCGSGRSLFCQGMTAAGIFLGLLLLVYLAGFCMDKAFPKVQESQGSLTERFPPQAVFLSEGREYPYYRNYFTTLLLIGVDRTEMASAERYRSGGQADFLLLLAMDRHNRRVTPIHIDRDTVTDVKVFSPFGYPAGTQKMQICLAYSFGKDSAENCRNTVWAVENLLGGVRVDEYLAVDMEGIALINDELGGVTVTLREDFSHLDPAMQKGVSLTLQGKQAEYFVRGRHEIGDNSNRQRMERQREFLNGLADKLGEKLESAPTFAGTLYERLSGHMETGVDQAWLSNQSYVITHYERAEICDLPGAHSLGADGYMEFHPDGDGLTEMLIGIFADGESEGNE